MDDEQIRNRYKTHDFYVSDLMLNDDISLYYMYASTNMTFNMLHAIMVSS